MYAPKTTPSRENLPGSAPLPTQKSVFELHGTFFTLLLSLDGLKLMN
jgi:hypothetical protein